MGSTIADIIDLHMQRFFPFIKEILHIYTSCLTDYTHFVVLRMETVEAVEGLAPSSTQLSLRGAVWVEPCLECAASVYLLGDLGILCHNRILYL